MKKKEYKPRVVDALLNGFLKMMGGVLIVGPKACGKTTTGKMVAKSDLLLSSPLTRRETQKILSYKPSLVLQGATPRLIDEWQVLPDLWDEIRNEIDQRGSPGQFILTGSAVPAGRAEIFHSGTGRFAWLTMRGMSLWESEESNGAVSLASLFSGNHAIGAINPLSVDQVAFAACRGGWPQVAFLKDNAALEYVGQYVKAIVNDDISRVDGVRRDPNRMMRLLRTYARHLGTQTSSVSMRNDLVGETESMFSIMTMSSYLKALQEIYVIEEMAAWNPNLRSKTAIRTNPTRYFTDPSVAVASLGIGPKDLLNDPETFGFVFENLCVRDLRIYAEALHGDVYHYRDKNGLECDAVIHRGDGSFGLVEIKLGGQTAIEHGAKTLTKLSGLLDTQQMPAPSFLMIVTATGDYAYRREDGILVVPVGCLKP